MAALAPGVVGLDATDSTGAAFSVAGLRPDANAITLDGLAFGAGALPQDALRNTRVVTSTYDVARGSFSGGVRERDGDEDRPAPPRDGEDEREQQPDDPPGADPREPDEDLVQRVPPVVDDPVLPMAIERGQTGTICFVCSIRCCRSNGLPTNA